VSEDRRGAYLDFIGTLVAGLVLPVVIWVVPERSGAASHDDRESRPPDRPEGAVGEAARRLVHVVPRAGGGGRPGGERVHGLAGNPRRHLRAAVDRRPCAGSVDGPGRPPRGADPGSRRQPDHLRLPQGRSEGRVPGDGDEGYGAEAGAGRDRRLRGVPGDDPCLRPRHPFGRSSPTRL